jgi:hypothetical protein
MPSKTTLAPAQTDDLLSSESTPATTQRGRNYWAWTIVLLSITWLIWQVCIVAFVINNPDTPHIGFTYPAQQLGFFGMWDERVYFYMYEKLRDEPNRWFPLFVKSGLPLGPGATLWILAKITCEYKPAMWVLYSALSLAAVIPLALFGRRFLSWPALWFLPPLLFLIHPGPWRFYAGFTSEGPANTFLCLAVFAVACAMRMRFWWAWSILAGLSFFAASEFRIAMRYGGYALALFAVLLLGWMLWRRWRKPGVHRSWRPVLVIIMVAGSCLACHVAMNVAVRMRASDQQIDGFYGTGGRVMSSVNPYVASWRLDTLQLDYKSFSFGADGRRITTEQQFNACLEWIRNDPLNYVGRCLVYVWRMWAGDVRQLSNVWVRAPFGTVGTLAFLTLQAFIGVLFLSHILWRTWTRSVDAVDWAVLVSLSGYTAVVVAFHSKPEYGACLIGSALALGMRSCTPRRLIMATLATLVFVLAWGLTSFGPKPAPAMTEALRQLPELTRVRLSPNNVTAVGCAVSFDPDGIILIEKDASTEARIDLRFPDQPIPVVRNLTLALSISDDPDLTNGKAGFTAYPGVQDGRPSAIPRLTTAPEGEDLDRFEDQLWFEPAILSAGFATDTFADRHALLYRTSPRVNRRELQMRDFGHHLTAVRLILPKSFTTGRLAPAISVRVVPVRPGMPDERALLAQVRSTGLALSFPSTATSQHAKVDPPATQWWPAWLDYANGLTLRSFTFSAPTKQADPTWLAELSSRRPEAVQNCQLVFHAVMADDRIVTRDTRLSRSRLDDGNAISALNTVPGPALSEAAALRIGIGLPYEPWTPEQLIDRESDAFPPDVNNLTQVPIIHFDAQQLDELNRAVGSRRLQSAGFLWPAPRLRYGEIRVSAKPLDRLRSDECALLADDSVELQNADGYLTLWADSGYRLLAPQRGESDLSITSSIPPVGTGHDLAVLDLPGPRENGRHAYQVVPMGWKYHSGEELLQLMLVHRWDGSAELVTDLRVGSGEAAAQDELVFRFMRPGPGIYYSHVVPEECANAYARTRIRVEPEHLRAGTSLHMSVCSRQYVPHRDTRLPVEPGRLGRFAGADNIIDIPMVWLQPVEAALLREAVGTRELISNVLIGNLPEVGLADGTRLTVLPDPMAKLGPGQLALLDMRLVSAEETPRIHSRRIIKTDLWLVESTDPSFFMPIKAPTIQELLQLW